MDRGKVLVRGVAVYKIFPKRKKYFLLVNTRCFFFVCLGKLETRGCGKGKGFVSLRTFFQNVKLRVKWEFRSKILLFLLYFIK